jgi:hypothetical protein
MRLQNHTRSTHIFARVQLAPFGDVMSFEALTWATNDAPINDVNEFASVVAE